MMECRPTGRGHRRNVCVWTSRLSATHYRPETATLPEPQDYYSRSFGFDRIINKLSGSRSFVRLSISYTRMHVAQVVIVGMRLSARTESRARDEANTCGH